MKRSVSFTPYIKTIVLIALIFSWSVPFFRLSFIQLKRLASLVEKYGYSEERKYEMLDNGYYRFMQICEKQIPADQGVLFIVIPEQLQRFGNQWLKKEYYLQKAPYYLYPRKIYRQEWLKDSSPEYTIVYDILRRQFFISKTKASGE